MPYSFAPPRSRASASASASASQTRVDKRAPSLIRFITALFDALKGLGENADDPEPLHSTFYDSLLEAFTEGNDRANQELLLAPLSFGERAARWASDNAALLVTRVTDTQRETVRTITAQALRDGLSVPDTAKLLETTVGLLPRQAQAVANQRAANAARWRKQGWKEDKITQRADAMAARYSKRLLRQRATTIARTELLRASNEGRLEAWQTLDPLGLATKRWVTAHDDRLCPICKPLDGEVRRLNEPFSVGVLVPPAHPMCRCTSAASFDSSGPVPAPVLKHLAGKHDQRSHGAKGIKDLFSAKAFLTQHYGAWRNGLTSKQDTAMTFYQSPGYKLMNEPLRGRPVDAPPEDMKRAKEADKNLRAAIAAAPPLEDGMLVYRGFSARDHDLTPGEEFTEPAFTSTSLLNDAGAGAGAVAEASGPQVRGRIFLPPGTKAAAGRARELVLPPGSRFKVIAKHGTTVDLELVLPVAKHLPGQHNQKTHAGATSPSRSGRS